MLGYGHLFKRLFYLVLIDTDQSIFVNGRFSLPSDIHRPIIYAEHRLYLNIVNFPETRLTKAIFAS